METRDDGVGNRVKLGVIETTAEAGAIVVNDASDALHSPGCATSGTGTCTLRDAITFANATVVDKVHFAIPGSGVHTIKLDSDLPTVTGELTIDGYTQPGSSPNTNGPGLGDNAVLLVEINGNGKGCFVLEGEANTIRGLVINRCGGPGVQALNVFQDNFVVGNFIGVDAAGSVALPNDMGMLVGPSDVRRLVIGGATPDARNVISGNRGAGVSSSDSIGDVVIRGNFIGTDITGTKAVPNGGSGIDFSGNDIGVEIGENVVSGNAGRGVVLGAGGGTVSASIHGNFIGTDVSGVLPLGNRSTGVWLETSGAHSVISGNTIAFNGIGDPIGGGIVAKDQTANGAYRDGPTILGNSIFDNTSDGSVADRGLGIDLVSNTADYGPGPNVDICEVGINPPMNFPVLTTAVATGSAIRLRGVLDGFPTTAYRIEFFANPTCDPSGYGEGKTFLGSTNVTPEGFDGNAPCNASSTSRCPSPYRPASPSPRRRPMSTEHVGVLALHPG